MVHLFVSFRLKLVLGALPTPFLSTAEKALLPTVTNRTPGTHNDDSQS